MIEGVLNLDNIRCRKNDRSAKLMLSVKYCAVHEGLRGTMIYPLMLR